MKKKKIPTNGKTERYILTKTEYKPFLIIRGNILKPQQTASRRSRSLSHRKKCIIPPSVTNPPPPPPQKKIRNRGGLLALLSEASK